MGAALLEGEGSESGVGRGLVRGERRSQGLGEDSFVTLMTGDPGLDGAPTRPHPTPSFSPLPPLPNAPSFSPLPPLTQRALVFALTAVTQCPRFRPYRPFPVTERCWVRALFRSDCTL